MSPGGSLDEARRTTLALDLLEDVVRDRAAPTLGRVLAADALLRHDRSTNAAEPLRFTFELGDDPPFEP